MNGAAVSELREVLVSGVGVVSAAGKTPAALGHALRARQPLPGDITAFEPAEGEPARAVEIAEFDLSRHVPSVKSYIDRTSALALAAGKMALDDAGLTDADQTDADGRGVGLSYGTQWGCLDSMELFFGKLVSGNPRFAPPLPFSHSYANSPASVMAIELGLRGRHAVYSTGRLSGAWALLGAADAVALGAADVMACAASDSFTRSAFRHYHSNSRLLPDDVPDALSDGRGRFLLGEGAACLVLETEDAARGRGAQAKAALLGVGSASGRDSASALEAAARDALERAKAEPGGLESFIGTASSAAGARSELAAAARLAGRPEEEIEGAFLSVGLVLGETMGASGLLAAAAGCACVEDGPVIVLAAEGPGEPDEGEGRGAAVAILLGPV